MKKLLMLTILLVGITGCQERVIECKCIGGGNTEEVVEVKEEYPTENVIYLLANDVKYEDNADGYSVAVRFSNGLTGEVSATSEFILPQDEESKNKLLEEFGSYENIKQFLINTTEKFIIDSAGYIKTTDSEYWGISMEDFHAELTEKLEDYYAKEALENYNIELVSIKMFNIKIGG